MAWSGGSFVLDHLRPGIICYDLRGKWRDHPLVRVGRCSGGSRSVLLCRLPDSAQDPETVVDTHTKNQTICGKAIEKRRKIRYTDK